MAFGVDDIVESALGPWGLAIGLGVSAIIASRQRLLPLVASSAGAGKTQIDRIGTASAQRTRASMDRLASAAALAGSGVAATGQLVERAKSANVKRAGQGVLLGLTRSWSELYAEAKAEFEATLPAAKGAILVDGERVDDLVQSPESNGRDARGRFIKRSEDA